MLKLLIATSNRGKAIEYRQIFSDLPIELLTLADKGISEIVEEQYYTYAENALHKALSYAEISHVITLADDSGLEVDALNGQPGITSARYAGKEASDKQRVTYLLGKLGGIPWERRTARFKCVIAICLPTGKSGIFMGECEGFIGLEPKGVNGFGYDPIFYFPDMQQTMAELSSELKNRISHRALAAQKAREMLKEMVEKS